MKAAWRERYALLERDEQPMQDLAAFLARRTVLEEE